MSRHEITGYEAVRLAARDYQQFSSDLQGDRDVRNYRQLPLESDPPDHAAYREALRPYFAADSINQHMATFTGVAHRLIGNIRAAGRGEVVHDLALPYVMECLGIIFHRRQDVDEWISWGPDVWTAEAYQKGEDLSASLRVLRERDFSAASPRSGLVLQRYIDRVFAEAQQRQNSGLEAVDIWDHVQRLTFGGRRATVDEKSGIASVLLAGGRDTVIKLITGLTWHLIRTPSDRKRLAANPGQHGRAIAELARYLSPLPKMERRMPGTGDDPGNLVLINFATANHDPLIWNDPEQVDIDRDRKPHLAFGYGRHSCLGMNITDREARAFLSALLADWPNWDFDGDPDINWVEEHSDHGTIRFLDRFDDLRVTSS